MMTMRRGLALALCCAVPLFAAACGDEDKDAASGGSATATEPFTVGLVAPTGQNPWMNAINATTKKVISSAGGTAEVSDAQLDPAKAVQQVIRFTNDGVKAIAVTPAQVPQAVAPALKKAHDAGIHTFGLEWSFADDPAAPPTAPIDGQVSIDRAALGKDVADAINAAFPDGAKVVYVGLPFPVVALDFFEKSFQANLGKSKLVKNLDNPKDNAQGALGPLNAALSSNPDTDAIVTYNGPSAQAAVQAVKAAGRTGKTKIYNIQIDGTQPSLIKDGSIEAAWDLNAPELGEALGKMMAAAAQGKPKGEWAKTVVVEPVKYTKDNIADWTDWAAQ